MSAPRRFRARRGLTIIELLISIVISAIVGLAMLRTIRGTLLFTEKSERGREARSVARSSLALVETDLQSVVATSTGSAAIEAATTTSATVRLPVTMGILCNASGSSATVSLLPTDSLALAEGNIAGTAYRGGTGDWTYVPGAVVPGSGLASVCELAAVGVTTLPSGVGASNTPAGRVITLSTTIPMGTPAGTLVMLYRRVRYDFAESALRPGRTALWRRMLPDAGTTAVSSLEIAGPFSSAASFGFYVGTSRVPLSTVPSDLRSIRGLELVLPGQSASSGRDGTAMAGASVRSSVFFRNRTD